MLRCRLPNLFTRAILSCWFFFPLERFIFIHLPKSLLFRRAYLWIFLHRYDNFLRDLTENTGPDNPEFQQLSSKSFRLPCLTAEQTLSHPCDKYVDGFIQPGLFLLPFVFVKICIKNAEPESPKATLITRLPSILVCHFCAKPLKIIRRPCDLALLSLS